MAVSLPLPHQCTGRSFFAPESILEAASQSESGDVLVPVDEGVFPFWLSNGISYGATPVCDLLIWDLTSGGMADFQLLADGYLLRRSFLGKK